MNHTAMPVRTSVGASPIEATISVPDVSGEEWISVYKQRGWSEVWEKTIRETTGLLLFVRVDSDKNHTPLDWHSFSARFGTPVGSPHSEPEEDESVGEAERQSKPPAPTQVVLVDWLQCFQQAYRARTSGDRRPRVGVVVAAWDLVPDDRKPLGPHAWLAENFPLLAQYLKANDDEFDLATFGVTVSNGNLANDESFRQAYLEAEPLRAGEVVVERGEERFLSVDVMLPVVWAMGLELPAAPKSAPANFAPTGGSPTDTPPAPATQSPARPETT